MVEPAATFDSAPEDRPARVLAASRSVVLFRDDGSVLARRVFDKDVVRSRGKVVGVGAGNERIAFARAEELLVAEERREREVARGDGVGFGGGVGVDAGEDELCLCGKRNCQ